jgi:hemerythrin
MSHAVFVAEIDDEHKEIYETLSELQKAVGRHNASSAMAEVLQELVSRIEDHFAHEERLMRAARYSSLGWHKTTHDSARKRVAQIASRIGAGDKAAGQALVEYLNAWLHDHTRLHDTMLGAFLRNHRRGVAKLTFRAGTRDVEACVWRDSKGRRFDPAATNTGY